MNTPAHVIFSLSLLGKNNAANSTYAIAVGALMPDVIMIVFYAYEKLRGVPEQIIWNSHYFLPQWQNLFDIFNSVPLLLLALIVSRHRQNKFLTLLFASMLIHCFFDFPVHHDDSHRHFFPLSDFRFQSPVSYWDPQHHGQIVGAIEMILVLAGSIYLWTIETTKVRHALELTHLRKVIILTLAIYIGYLVFVLINWA